MLQTGLIFLIRCYQVLLSPILGGKCRFYPSCSQYGVEAIQKRGPFSGVFLIVRRLLRCHPWGGFGYDPVPEPEKDKVTK
ncbi:MAG: membrane protein insertion efficiency factor YidD [Bdellovibrionaceae bacterium]|nr:membrane protein insertion efficiency factor YidD [Pseudobdellovibrionaceae bacterium]